MGSRRLLLFVLLVLFAFGASGCAKPKLAVFDSVVKDTVLILPPTNAVQGGVPHPYEAGKSGPLLMHEIQKALESRGWAARMYAGDELSHMNAIDTSQMGKVAEEAAERLLLYVKLGEFRDAAPMTFRSDYVYLIEVSVYDTAKGAVIASLEQPIRYDGPNLDTFWRFFPDIAEDVANALENAVGS